MKGDITDMLSRSSQKFNGDKPFFKPAHQKPQTTISKDIGGDTRCDPIILSTDSDDTSTDEEMDDDDDDDDPLSIMNRTFSKTSSTLSSFSSKRSLIFDQDTSDVKKLKLPPVVKAPFIRKNDGSTLRKSAELSKLHEKDEQEAIEKLITEKPIRDLIMEKLDRKVIENKEYVDYLALHHEDLNLNDFHYIKEAPPYVKPKTMRNPIEMYLIHGMIRQQQFNESKYGLYEFDVFNELESFVVEREIAMIKDEVKINVDEINEFMINLGVSKNMIEKEQIIKEDLDIDSKECLQDIRLILLKFQYLITKILHSKFNEEKFKLIMKIFGLFIMDKRVHSIGASKLFSELLNDLLKWRYDANFDSTLYPIVNIWYNLTNELNLLIRIVETLTSDVSDRILQLRRLFSLNIFLQGELSQTIEDSIKYDYAINDEILTKLNDLNLKGKEYFHDGNFHNIKLEFQCLFQCINLSSNNGKIGFKSEEIKQSIDDIRTKIATSFQNSDQAAFKSVLLLISTALHHHNQSSIIMHQSI